MKTKPRDDNKISLEKSGSALSTLTSIGAAYMETGILDGMRLLSLDKYLEALYKITAKDMVIQIWIATDPKKVGVPLSGPLSIPEESGSRFCFDMRIMYDAYHFNISHSPYISMFRNSLGSAESIERKFTEAVEFAQEVESNGVLKQILRDGKGFATREAVEEFLRRGPEGR